MNLEEAKVWVLNSFMISVTTFGQIEDWLKIILLIVTIGYTAAKWVKVHKDNTNDKEK